MNEKDVMNAVEVFIEKYGGPPAQRVKWPQWEFRIKGIPNVELDEMPLNKFQQDHKELWTFKGVVDIAKTDGVTEVQTTRKYNIVGNTTFTLKLNGWNQNELLPEIENVTITKIEEI